jgi:hypothetical protein
VYGSAELTERGENGAAEQAGDGVDRSAMLFWRHSHGFGQANKHRPHELDHRRLGKGVDLARGDTDVDNVNEELLSGFGVTSKSLGNIGMSSGVRSDRTDEASQGRIFDTHAMRSLKHRCQLP